jgi:ubiquinone/menaquinone biosynthesis C-methylase UbiE
MASGSFATKSYAAHAGVYANCMAGGEKSGHAKTWTQEDTVDAWRHRRMYACIDPLLTFHAGARWLTVGDGRYGNDAHYIREHAGKVTASDISEDLLREARDCGYIDDYRVENAEALTSREGEFDFVLCKESYHHFPRPMIALYEMLRVASRAVALVEPIDRCAVNVDPGFRQECKNLVKRVLGREVVRNAGPDSAYYEDVGNFVYAISKREMCKVALGLNLPCIAFKGLNDHYVEGVEYQKAEENNDLFRKVRSVIEQSDALCRQNRRPYDLLAVIIFKEKVSKELENQLLAAGFEVMALSQNPHLKSDVS